MKVSVVPTERPLLGTEDDRPDRRVRRSLDLFDAVAALVVLALFLGLVHGLPTGSNELSNDVVRALRGIPHDVGVGGLLLALLASLVLVPLSLNTLLRRDPLGAIAAAVAAALGAGACLIASLVWSGEHGGLDHAVLHGSNPTVLVYDCAFIAYLTASDLVRRRGWTRWCVAIVAGLLLFGLASASLSPFALPVAAVGGLLFGWLLRWSLGTLATRPTAEELTRLLRTPDLRLGQLSEVPGSGGSRLAGFIEDGRCVEVRLAGRDTAGAGLARHLWTLVRQRSNVSGRPALSSRARLERMSLASLLAEQGGALVPNVLTMREVNPETLALMVSIPQGRHPAEDEAPSEVSKLFAALRQLHDLGVAHRDLRSTNLVLTSERAGFCSLDSAQPAAGELLQRLDVAQLLTTAAHCSNAEVAVEAFREAYRPADVVAFASVLQPIALTTWGYTEMRSAGACLAEMRAQLVGPDADLPAPSLERFRWRTLLTAIAVVAAAFILIGQLSKVDLGGALGRANWAWCAVAVGAAAVGTVAAAENLAAFVPRRLSVLRSSAVQLATAFVGVAMPSTVSHIAVNSRYLHREGIDGGSITAAVTLSQIVNVVTTVLVLLVIGVLTGSGVSRFKITPSPTLLGILGAVAVLAGIFFLVPRTRVLITRNVWPRLRSVWPRLLQALSSPVRLILSAGANLALSTCNVISFVAAILAVGGHPAILPTAAVLLAGNAVGSAAPTPGGVGAVEAILSAGLSAIGIPVHVSIPAVLIFRLATFWLPIPAGWVSYTVLQRRGVL